MFLRRLLFFLILPCLFLICLDVHAQCTDPNLFADACDFDGDGVINSVDLDDDNDGVIDSLEQICYTSGNLTEGLAPGTHHMDTWLLVYGIRIRHVETTNYTAVTNDFNVINHPSYPAQGDPDNKMIYSRALRSGISIAFFDSDSVTKLTTTGFSIWSDPFSIPLPAGALRVIARDINGNTILDRTDPDGSQHVIDITQTGGIPIHEVVVAYNSSAFDLISLEGGCFDRDSDLDLAPNRLDLDSDGDVCSDAYEAGATTDNGANFQFADVLGDPDGLSPSVDVAGDGTTDYTSTYTVNALTNATSNCPVVLSVNWSFFKAEVQDQKEVRLSWQIDTEMNLDYYVLEKSQNEVDWQEFSSKNSLRSLDRSAVFEALDSKPYTGRSLYRIKYIDLDGIVYFSPSRSVQIEETLASIVDIYPNPFQDQIRIHGNTSELENIRILNVVGQDLTHLTETIYQASDERVMDMSSLSSGVYFVQLKSSTYTVSKR